MRGLLDMFDMKNLRNIEHTYGLKIIHTQVEPYGYCFYGRKDGQVKKYRYIKGKLAIA